MQVTSGVTTVASELKKYDGNQKYSYDQLKATPLPPGVDASLKEVQCMSLI